MNFKRRIEKLEALAGGGSIRFFEDLMSETRKVLGALESGMKLDTIRLRRFHPSLRNQLSDLLERADELAQEDIEAGRSPLGLEILALLIIVHRDAEMSALLSPRLREIVEQFLEVERAGKWRIEGEGPALELVAR